MLKEKILKHIENHKKRFAKYIKRMVQKVLNIFLIIPITIIKNI